MTLTPAAARRLKRAQVDYSRADSAHAYAPTAHTLNAARLAKGKVDSLRGYCMCDTPAAVSAELRGAANGCHPCLQAERDMAAGGAAERDGVDWWNNPHEAGSVRAASWDRGHTAARLVRAPAMRAAAERHCDLMRQGFMRLPPVPPHTPAQIEAGKAHAARILAKLDGGK